MINKKLLFMALSAVITVGAFMSVLAQNNLIKLPLTGWLAGSTQPASKISAPAFNAAQTLRRDGNENYPTSGTFNNSLSSARISEHQDGDLVVVMSAAGELPGTLTLKLHRDADGVTVTGGEWAFLVSYTEDIENEDGTHGEALVQRGTIKGTVSGGQLTLGEGGIVNSVNAVQMVVNGGTLTFQEAQTGTGSGQITNLQNPELSSGNLTLTF